MKYANLTDVCNVQNCASDNLNASRVNITVAKMGNVKVNKSQLVNVSTQAVTGSINNWLMQYYAL